MNHPDRMKELTEALGRAALHCWGDLPQEIQQRLFEDAAARGGSEFRSALAVYLHEHHPRTAD